MTLKAVDPITLEVMRNGFYSIADEMIAALIRASYSTNIKDRRDTSCAIYTGRGDVVVIAQSEIGTPLHLGTMHSAVQAALAAYPFEQLEPGDAIATNTPYPAGPGHLNDLCLIAPVFHEGKMIAITANQAHHVDMGGFAPGSMPFGVTEIFQGGPTDTTGMSVPRRRAGPRAVGNHRAERQASDRGTRRSARPVRRQHCGISPPRRPDRKVWRQHSGAVSGGDA